MPTLAKIADADIIGFSIAVFDECQGADSPILSLRFRPLTASARNSRAEVLANHQRRAEGTALVGSPGGPASEIRSCSDSLSRGWFGDPEEVPAPIVR